MRTLSIFLGCMLCSAVGSAQLKTTVACSSIQVDILDGKVNGVEPDFTSARITRALPCFTAVEPDSSRCGGAVLYKDKDLYFYTGRDYIEIREKFKGRLNVPVMGAARNTLFKWLGHPKIREAGWEAYQMNYGTLVVYFNKAGKVNKLQFSKLAPESISLCE